MCVVVLSLFYMAFIRYLVTLHATVKALVGFLAPFIEMKSSCQSLCTARALLDLKRTRLKGEGQNEELLKGLNCLQMMWRVVKTQGVQEAPSIGVFAKLNAMIFHLSALWSPYHTFFFFFFYFCVSLSVLDCVICELCIYNKVC